MQEQTAWLEQQTEQHKAALTHVQNAQAESDTLRAELAKLEDALNERDQRIVSLQSLLNLYQELKGECSKDLSQDVSLSEEQHWSPHELLVRGEDDKILKGDGGTCKRALTHPQPVLEKMTGSVVAATRRKVNKWWAW